MWKAIVICLISFTSFAQIKVNFPVERMTYQRSNTNQATVYISGNFYSEYDSIQARVEPRVVGQGTATSWKGINYRNEKPYFEGNLDVQGGWYSLFVRAFENGVVTHLDTVERVGVGEVFVIAGQSNAQGGASPGIPSTSDRVNAVGYDNDSTVYNKLPIGFSKIDQDSSSIGPFHYVPWVWGKVGDALVDSLNVPVCFYGAAHGGTSVRWWYEAAKGLPLTSAPVFVNEDLGAPFKALEVAVSFYASLTGIRGVLWQQGESDHFNTSSEYQLWLEGVIDETRNITQFNDLAWMVARSSRAVGTSLNPINGQNAVITADANVFPGPATDPISGTSYRSDGIHFDTFLGQIEYATYWMGSLNTSFFTSSTPLLAEPFIPMSFVCDSSQGASPVVLSIGSGYSTYAWSERDNSDIEAKGYSNNCCNEFINYPPSGYLRPNWSLDSTNQIQSGFNKYWANAKNSNGKYFFSHIVDLTNSVIPPQPTLFPETSQIRVGTSVQLFGFGCGVHSYEWDNAMTGDIISVSLNSSTSFQVRCKELHCAGPYSLPKTVIVSNCYTGPISLSGNVSSPEPPFRSKSFLLSAQKIQPSGHIEYSAKDAIYLNPGFQSDNSSIFKAEIIDCN